MEAEVEQAAHPSHTIRNAAQRENAAEGSKLVCTAGDFEAAFVVYGPKSGTDHTQQ